MSEIKSGEGLWKQIDKATKVVYTSLTHERLIEVLTDMTDNWERDPWRERLREMFTAGLVTAPQFDTMLKMINSSDYENFILAQEIIKSKSIQYGNPVYSRDSQIRKLG